MASVTIDQAVLSEPLDISDLTTKKLDGTGAFDILLQTARVHLGDQYDKSRIRGPEYATVYLGMFEAVLNASISFLLSKEKQALEIKGLELQNTLAQAQIDQIHDQMQKTPYEIELLQAQVAGAQVDAELKRYQMDFLYPAQLEQANKQNELLEAQIANQTKQLELLEEQVKQAVAQTAYYDQKTITEVAQTDGSVIKTGSVIRSQVDLMDAQKAGYQRNAEQQAAQIISNTWNVRRQTDEDTQANTTNLLDDATVGKVMQKMLAGISVTVNPS